MNLPNVPLELAAECAAPLFAILLEWLPFPSENQLHSNAEDFVRRRGISGENAPEEVKRYAKGTLSLASVTPTLIAVVATISSFHSVHMLLGCMFAILLAFWALNAWIGGRPPDDYEKVIIVRGALWDRVTRSKIISWSIRAINVVLIAMILAHGWSGATSNPCVPAAEAATASAPNQPPQHNKATRRFQGGDLRIPVGDPNAIPIDICFQPDVCDEIGRKRAADTYCQIQHFAKSVSPLLVIGIRSPTRFIGAVPQKDCPNVGCNTFQFIDCSD